MLLVFTVFVLVIGFAVTVFYLLQQPNRNNISQNYDNVNLDQKGVSSNQNTEKTTKSNEELFIAYLLDSIEIYARKGYILESIDGDVTAAKLTEAEVKNNRDLYTEKLKGLTNDKETVISYYEKQNNKYFVYSIEKVLNKLGLSTHMGVGVGLLDTRGMKLYTVGQTAKESADLTDVKWVEDRVSEFGYDNNIFVNQILDSIEKYASNGNILKSTDGNIAAAKLTVEEAKYNREEYKQKINSIINNRDIFSEVYLENGTLNCKYEFESVLVVLGLSSHMGVGIEVDREGNKVFSW